MLSSAGAAEVTVWAGKTPKIIEVLTLLYLYGLSSGGFVPSRGQFLGGGKGLSGPVVTKLTEQWKTDRRAFVGRSLSDVDFVCLWD